MTTDGQSLIAMYDVAEALADAVDPRLSEAVRDDVFGMLYAGESDIALSDLLRAVHDARCPVPTDILAAARNCVDDSLVSSTPDRWGHDMRVEMQQWLQTIPDSGQIAGTIGTFGDRDLSSLVIKDAGLSDDAPRDHKTAAIKAWLASNKPGWSLRQSLRWDGYGELLDQCEDQNQP